MQKRFCNITLFIIADDLNSPIVEDREFAKKAVLLACIKIDLPFDFDVPDWYGTTNEYEN